MLIWVCCTPVRQDCERYDAWCRVARGDADVVDRRPFGGLCTPERLGLIVVDEEHDGSYKQSEGFVTMRGIWR